MINHNETFQNNEVDINELFSKLWQGKIFILLFALFTIFLASVYLHQVERKYTVEYDLKPVNEVNPSQGFSGISGLASIAGIQFPSNSSSDFNIYKKLIISQEVSEIIFENKKMIKDIFRSEWNETLNNYSRPPKSKIKIFASRVKKLLTGNKNVSYLPPNPRRLALFIDKNIQRTLDTETGFIKFMSETTEPELMLSIIIEASKVSDNVMRQRYIDFSIEPLAFYKEQLRIARSREHREVLAELISKEEQKLMLASRGKYFIAEPVINPKISLFPTSPKPKLVLALSLVMGIFLGAAFVLIRHAMKKES
jgi:LPS O-antigen subunit length determinant protein (WzzB/FepE family)